MGASQKSKGKKRPRAWHHGPDRDQHQAIADRDFARAEQLRRELDAETGAFRRELRDDHRILASMVHAAPFVPRLEARL